MILTEHLLNAGRRPQTSKRARKSPYNWVGQKKTEKKRERNESGWDLHPWEGAVKEEDVSTHREVPSLVGDKPGQRGNFKALEKSTGTCLWRTKGERPTQMVSAITQNFPA